MAEALKLLLSGLVIPAAGWVLKRHYDQQPDSWEKVFGWILLCGLAIAASVFVLSFNDAAHRVSWALGALDGFVAAYLFLAAFLFAVLAWSEFSALRRSNNGESPGTRDGGTAS